MSCKFSLYFLAALFTTGYSSVLHAESSLPTHCKQNEFAYLNALMANFNFFKNRDDVKTYELVKNGKVLSICADRKSEPLNQITYRYGLVGEVEIEINGTIANKFNIYEQSTSPHTGDNIFFFKNGDFTYYVTEATAQGSGIGLRVYRNGKRVVNLFSGNGNGIDFESSLFDINFYEASSPIFVHQKPRDPIYK